jgi:protein-S-isoprenylcysteine O-methyltransferase Ste14
MKRIRIVLEEPTLKTLAIYYWGQFLSNEYAMLFVGLFLLRNFVEIFSPASRRRYVFTRKRRRFASNMLAVVFLISGGVTGYTLIINGFPSIVTFWTGIGLLILGIVGRRTTLSILRPEYPSYWEMILHERLIIAGMFALIRYPLSTFYLIEMVAFILIAWNCVSFGMLAAAWIIITGKIEHEERRLSRRFGERFSLYCLTSKRLIPFVY